MQKNLGSLLALTGLALLVGCGGGEPSTPKPTTKPGATTTTGTKTQGSGSDSSPAVKMEGWGNLVGKFVYDGTAPTPTPLQITKDQEVCAKHNLVDESLVVGEDGGIANIVIYVRTKDVKVSPDAKGTMPTLDNKNCRFAPHILAFDVSNPLTVLNSDPVAHNTNIQPLGDTGINPLIEAGGMVEHKFSRAQTIPVPAGCNIHPWMKGFILPRENPYAAVTAEDGTFKLENLPAGELEFQVWQEKAGYLAANSWEKGRFTMVIEPDKDNDLGEIKVSPSLFEVE